MVWAGLLSRPRWSRRGISCLVLSLIVAVTLAGCERKRAYSQSTPDDVLKSAVSMAKSGDARRLTDLVHAESPEMRELLNRVGVLLSHMQKLSQAAAQRWPDEFARLQKDAADKAAGPGGATLMSMLSGMNRGNRQEPPSPDDARAAINALLADPYGWLEHNGARLSAIKTSDDTASVLLDGQPLIPIVGLPMRQEGGKWFVSIPSGMPPLSGFWPRTRQQWSILGSLVQVLDNTVVALTQDVSQGKVGSLKGLTDKAQEKAMLPALLAFAAYGKEMDVRQRTDRRMKQFQARQSKWLEARRSAATDEGASPAVSPRLISAMTTVAAPRLEESARKQTSLGLDKLSDADFEGLLNGWLSEAGVGVTLSGDLSAGAVDKKIEAWDAARKAASTKR